MRARHKPPTLVSMWMLDVFCCALGCVTLLWLLNTREAGVQASRAGSALELLNKTESELKSKQTELLTTMAEFDRDRRRLNSEIEDLAGKLLAMTTERDETEKFLAKTKEDLAATEGKRIAAAARSQELDDMLQRKQKEAKDLTVRLTAATTNSEDLAKLLRQKEREREDVALKAKKAEDQLNDVDAKLRAIAKENQDAKSDLAAMKKTGDELAQAKATIRDITKKADENAVQIIDLQGQKAKLADKYDKLQRDSEARFAGIALTGRRVVFVVDMSGSMKLIDDKTAAPDKWSIVAETIGRVMRSLPELEQFQVVTFSRKAQYLFGEGEWLPYQGEASVRRTVDTLKKIDPAGDTNIYEAMDLTFRLKSGGLDTIYLFSDGLPTSGQGLTSDEEKKLTDAARTEKLARHLRSTLTTVWNRPADPGRVRINAVGFFFESPDVGAFLWALSRENDGSFVGMSRP